MKELSFLAIVVIIPFLFGCTDDYRGSIEGQVRATEESIFGEVTPAPVPDFRVEARSMKNGRKVESYTNAEGNYVIDDVQFGLNEITGDREGYETITKYADVEKDQATEINILTNKIPKTAEVNLTFIVTDDSTAPVSNAVVDLFAVTRDDFDYTDRAYEYIDTAWTGDTGHAVFMAVARVAEFHVTEFRVVVAAYGYTDAYKDFALTYDTGNREFEITLHKHQD